MTPEFDARDESAMDAALDAALRGPRGANPLVGAVLTDETGRILHTGRHMGSGTPHAEVDLIAAARSAGTDLRGTTLYVTLEPCHHTGRTGPCSQAILEAGIRSVVCATADTTETAAGGARFLAANGVDVRSGLHADRARRMNARWWTCQEEGRPFVTAKIAATQDGVVSAEDGTSQWITGPEARAHGHRLRARADTIMVGTGTALTDNPRLTARGPEGETLPEQPRRAVMGLRRLPAGAALDDGEEALRLPTRSPREALDRLARENSRHVLIEGGPGIVSAFLAEGLVDELYWYTAPKLLGSGRRAIAQLGATTLSDALPLTVDPAGAEADATTHGIGLLGQDTLTHLAAEPAPATERK